MVVKKQSFLVTVRNRITAWLPYTNSYTLAEIVSDIQNLSFQQFQTKYHTNYKDENSWKGTIRRMYNTLKRSRSKSEKNFGQDVEHAYKNRNVAVIPKCKYNKPVKIIRYKHINENIYRIEDNLTNKASISGYKIPNRFLDYVKLTPVEWDDPNFPVNIKLPHYFNQYMIIFYLEYHDLKSGKVWSQWESAVTKTFITQQKYLTKVNCKKISWRRTNVLTNKNVNENPKLLFNDFIAQKTALNSVEIFVLKFHLQITNYKGV